MKKIASTVLACAMAVGLAGCTIKSPETVGSIGDTEFTAGSYLLAQYSAVNQLMNLVDDSSATVQQALKTEVTTEDGETMQGSDFVAQKTLENLEYTAGLNAAVAEHNITLTEDEQTQIDTMVEQTLENYGDHYAENGIGEKTIRTAYEQSALYSSLFEAVYGDDGEKAISDEEKQTWLDENATAGTVLVLPLSNTDDSEHEVSDADKDAVRALAQEAADQLNAGTSMDEIAEDTLSAAFEKVGMEFDAESDLASYESPVVIMPSELSYYGDTFQDAVKDLKDGEATTIEQSSTVWVFLCGKASELEELSEIESNYDLPSLMKNDDFADELTASGAAMENKLDQSAMNAYKASKVKLS